MTLAHVTEETEIHAFGFNDWAQRFRDISIFKSRQIFRLQYSEGVKDPEMKKYQQYQSVKSIPNALK